MLMDLPLIDKNNVRKAIALKILSPLDILQNVYDLSPLMVPFVFGDKLA